MKNKQLIRHIRRTLLPATSMLCVLLALQVAGLFSSCADDRLSSAPVPGPDSADNTDMYLSVSVPRSLSGSDADGGKETNIETLDVLVFRNGVGNAHGSYFVYAACRGELTSNGKTFQVAMPIGEHFNIHVFANCHDALVAKGFYNSRGKEMNTLLKELTTGVNINNNHTTAIPMHGYISDVTIRETDSNRSLTIPVLRSVSSVQVMTNLTQSGSSSAPTLTPGDVTDATGNKNFELRELYVYFYPDSVCIAPAATAYESIATGAADETRNVKTVSLPSAHRVSDTRQDAVEYPDNPRPYSLISPAEVSRLGSIYFYENRPWSDTGFDQPDETILAATTRLVVGGVYGTDKNADGTPRVTYYRVDFTGTNGKLTEILRNHQYIFNIKTVSGSGYDTPDDAALGVPVNMYVEVIDWVNKVEYTDFDMQNYFYSETKFVRLSRDARSVQSITVESDVEAFRWEMAFATNNNGEATTSADGNTLANNRYQVEKAADGKSLTFTSLKDYNDVNGAETTTETLRLKVRNMNITYRITQADSSPDDWGNGGDLESDLGEIPPIKLPGITRFEIAPGNLIGYRDANGVLKYKFAETQADVTREWNGGGYFNFGCADPLEYRSNYNTWQTNVCARVGGKYGTGWTIPQRVDLVTILGQARVYGTRKDSGGSTIYGFYIGTNDIAQAQANPDNYAFLPATGFRSAGSQEMRQITAEGYYRCMDGAGSSLNWWSDGSGLKVKDWDSGSHGFSIRCIRYVNL